jgi:capsular polysaccharide biosynthesis protein
VNEPQETVSSRQNGFRDLFAAYADPGDFDDLPLATDASAGLVSLGFIGSALRRRMLIWLSLTVLGLVLGLGLGLSRVPGHLATTTVLVETSTSSQNTEMQTDAAIAQSTPVAAAVVAQLGIQETPASFLQSYTAVAGITTTILTITAKGPSDEAAVQRATAVATQFLTFRAKYLQGQLNQTIAALNQQVNQAQQHLASIQKQISQLSAESDLSADQAALLGALRNEVPDATNAIGTAKTNASYSQLQAQTTTAQMVHGSEVLSAATPAKRSAKKALALYAVGGLIGGLAIGIAIAVIGGITTDRLRRRDDIAVAVGAPVRLSVGSLRGRRWVPDLRGRSGRRSRDMERVVQHLRNAAVPPGPQGAASLAVVIVDDAPTAAQAVVRLAVAGSQQRKRVVLADLSAGAPAARQLGVTGPGIGTVTPEGVSITVVVPEAQDVAPVGPLGRPPLGSPPVNEQLTEVCAHADLILSIVTLDPAFSSDYLRTWATTAVVVATAGQSTATRLHAVGEMVRLAGTQLASVVVLDADRDDESLGAVAADYQPGAALRA